MLSIYIRRNETVIRPFDDYVLISALELLTFFI